MINNRKIKSRRNIYILVSWFFFVNCAGRDSNTCNRLTRYTCKDGICITKARVCDGHWDCKDGEDEAHCVTIAPCPERNEIWAELNGYTCRRSCAVSSDCKAPNKTCICDDECGLSCLNPKSQCEDQPPEVRDSIMYYGQQRNNFSNPTRPPWYGPFILGDVMKYDCKKDMQLVGPLPRCNGKKRWSTEIPTCIFPQPTSSFGIKANSSNGLEIYFLFDISQSSLNYPRGLKMEFEFAKRLVERVKSFERYVNFGITLYANTAITVLDITDVINQPPAPNRVIEMLDDVFYKVISHAYDTTAGKGTDTALAFEKLRPMIAYVREFQRHNNRYVFTFTDGRHTQGHDPVIIRKKMEREFGSDIEFYSIAACARCYYSSDQEELIGLASRPENYIYIESFYRLSAYLDQVTDLKINFEKCGQTGNIGSNQATALRHRRSVNGKNATEGAWPWQALLTIYSETPEQVFRNENHLGGGSIINRYWILTGAQILKDFEKSFGWTDEIVISVGVIARPVSGESMKSTIQLYSVADYIQHGNFDENNFLNDIALIKVGPKYNSKMKKNMENVDGIEYGYYVRPVCLPCKSTCVTENYLRPFTNDQMSPEEKCLVEEKFLLETDAKVVATGYGHQKPVSNGRKSIRHLDLPEKLQQALLKIEDESECRRGVDIINSEVGEQLATYTDRMICCTSGDPVTTIDMCAGDAGGPVVREVKNTVTGESCWIQIGIISFGWGCGRADLPGYYTNVAKYVSWIDEKMQQSDAEP